jgi:radical SAM protein with 4Fe4S-binding SPASM domain
MVSERHSELRVLRWTDRIQDILAGERRGPIRANLDLTNLCNHACPWCEPVDFRKATIADKRHTLSALTAYEVLQDLKELDCRAVQFSGGGEPMLHPVFGGILGQAHEFGFRTFVITNGGLIDRWIEPLFRYADHVRVSLDASCEKEHQKMHGSKPGEFGNVVENVKTLVKRKSAGTGPEVGIAYNVADCNSSPESIERLFRLAGGLGVDFVQVRPLSEQTPLFLTSASGPWGQIERRVLQFGGHSFRLEILGQRHRDVFYQREFERCYAALSLAVISANGDVAACCDERGKIFGNVNERPFRSIWLSNKHREIASKIVPMLCQRCVQCGYNRAVERFVVKNEAMPELL